MTSHTRELKRFWLLAVLVLIGGFTISFLAARHTANTGQQEEKPVTSQDSLPKIISKVKELEVVSARVFADAQGSPATQVAIEVKNNSSLAVYYFALSNGDIKTSQHGVSRNGLVDPDNPQVAIQPYGTATLNMSLANLDGRYPIVLSAAVFADGAEKGDESVLEHMRAVRARDKAIRDAEKEKAKQEAEKGERP